MCAVPAVEEPLDWIEIVLNLGTIIGFKNLHHGELVLPPIGGVRIKYADGLDRTSTRYRGYYKGQNNNP